MMRRTMLVLAASCLLPLLTTTTPIAATPDQAPVAPAQTAVVRLYLPMAYRGWLNETTSLGDPYAPGKGNPGYDVSAYDLSFKVNIDDGVSRGSYEATAAIDLVADSSSPGRLAFDYASSGTVAAVTVNGTAAEWYAGRGDKLWVEMPAVATKQYRVEVAYSGEIATSRGGIRIAGTTQGHQVYTVLGNASAWFPANDHPSDRARFVFHITAAAPLVAVANGTCQAVPEVDGLVTTSCDSGVAFSPAGATMVVGPFTVVDGASRSGVRMRHYLLQPEATARPRLRAIEQHFDYLNKHLWPYPFAVFGVVEVTPLSTGAAPTLLLAADSSTYMRPAYVDYVSPARVASEWFGWDMSVTSPRDNWLNSGLTTYLGYWAATGDQGPEPVRSRMAQLEDTWANWGIGDVALSEMPADGSGSTATTVKTPWAYHGLRDELGPDVFWATLVRYRQQTAGTADLAALQAAAEAVTGRSLTTLFDRLFRQAATPQANLTWVQTGDTVRLRLCQLRPEPVPFTLPVALHGDAGVTEATVTISGAEATAEVAYAGHVEAITPDPDQSLLADILVHPATGPTLPACADLPPPVPTTGAAAPDTATGAPPFDPAAITGDGILATMDAEAAARRAEGLSHLSPDLRAQVESDSLRPRVAGDSLAPAMVPGEPSIGDPYLPTLGNSGYDVQRYLVKVRLDPRTGELDGDTTIEAVSTLDGLDRLSLDFWRTSDEKGLAVRSVTVDGQGATFERPADTDKLWVNLPAAKASGEALAVRVLYAGTPIRAGGGSFSGGLLLASRETMYAISEPSGTRNWIPCNDHPRDKATYRFEVTVPDPFVAVANGVAIEERPAGSDTTFVFEMRQPMASYLASVAVGRYQRVTQTSAGGVPINHYFLDDPKRGMAVAGVTPDVLDVFSRLVAPYPFDTYGHYAAPGFGGGMENQSLTAIGANAFNTNSPRSSHYLISHEAAHQWFGDAISPYTWSDIWLNEGFATYFDELWRASKVGPEPLAWRMDGRRLTVLINGRDAPVGQPVPSDFFGTNTYDKGGWVVHMLRAAVGETAFWAGIRDYYQSHLYGSVRTADLVAAMEAASGQELDPFFAQWVNRGGNPSLRAAWSQSGRTVNVRLCQPGAPFDLPVTLAVHGGDQTVRWTGRATGPETDVALDVPFDADGVTVDPDFQLLAHIRVQRATDSDTLPSCTEILGQ